MSIVLFWVSLAFVLYTYLGYPVLLYVQARLSRRDARKDARYLPLVSFLVVAHNEEKVLRGKLENTLSLDYPRDRMEVIVASDGSTDGTEQIVMEFTNRGVKLQAYGRRRGKAATLNSAITMCEGEVVVFSDSRQMFAPNAVRELVANFADPTVGAVTGNLQFDGDSANDDVKRGGVYWRYEQSIRTLQSKKDSLPVVTGAMYAMRRRLYRSIPGTCIADDLAIPMNVVMQGYRVIYEPTAKAFDRSPKSIKEEFSRKVRTIAGSYQFLTVMSEALNPKANRIWLDFMSHKVCRVVAPIWLAALLVTNMLIDGYPYRGLLILQAGFYGIAISGLLYGAKWEIPKLLSAPSAFVMLNAAAAVALMKVLTGRQSNLWDKSEGLREA